ncbi:RimK family alpha-L-glutamate ligase [Saccharicrinis sp. FJH2]|uniref:ATP-grasp domain-containing protein n=1 Tax=Saccharicrinis sp. FJH65 TaxID=3344659 RepID=UPI0035F39E6A
MKLAIHNRLGSFSDGWIKYCQENKIPFKIVNCYDNDIIDQLEDCDGLMWHWDQNDYRAPLFARQLTIALNKKNIKVFPDINTSWHFDDKLGQKYLMEALGAPYVKSYVFYTKKEALQWIKTTSYPKVFKQRGGASGINVLKVENSFHAKKLISKAFGNGFTHFNRKTRIKDKLWLLKRDKNLKALKGLIKGIIRLFVRSELEKLSSNDKGYIFFQEFIPNNTFDTRYIVVGNRCFGTRRYCRPGDFRASGSGLYDNSPNIFDKRCIQIAFDIAKKIDAQSIAFDFLWKEDMPVICEISYIYCRDIIANCDGYWDEELNWIKTEINAEKFIIQDFINSMK